MKTSFVQNSSGCTGCGVCVGTCRSHAINWVRDEEGFLCPEVNEELCSNCGLCREYCPQDLGRDLKPLGERLDVFAFQAEDSERRRSSSGALFPLAAEIILARGGYVAGCIFDDKLHARHILTCEASVVDKMRGAKYIQSDASSVYNEVLSILKKGMPVLFTGTPCQVAAMKRLAGGNDELLITIDILCHGVSNDFLFHRNLTESYGDKVVGYSFRDKKLGWSYELLSRVDEEKSSRHIACHEDAYFSAFLDGMSLRRSCYDCPFAGKARMGDLTIGDFWGIESYDKRFRDHKGTSLVIINSDKGREIFEKIRPMAKLVKPQRICDAIAGNQTLKGPTLRNASREAFFRAVRDGRSIAQAYECAKNERYDFAIANFWWTNNFGAILTAYALQQVLKRMGYTSRLISGLYGGLEMQYRGSISERFARHHLTVTEHCVSDADFATLNNHAGGFISGSDQVWRGSYSRPYHYLSFAKLNKKKIAVSASFGLRCLDCGPYDAATIQKWIRRFTAVSVREDSGVEICRGMSLKAEHIIDPVFLLDQSSYLSLAHEAPPLSQGGGLGVYVLDMGMEKQEIILSLQSRLSTSLTGTHVDSVEAWLSCLANSKYVVTDSFHGVCFAMIFRKPVVCLGNESRGGARFESLFRQVGIDARRIMANDAKHAYDVLLQNWDNLYVEIDKRLDAARKAARTWLSLAVRREVGTEDAIRILEDVDEEMAQLKNSVTTLVAANSKSFSHKIKKLRYKLGGILLLGATRKRYRQKYRELKHAESY